jgi:ferredoxin
MQVALAYKDMNERGKKMKREELAKQVKVDMLVSDFVSAQAALIESTHASKESHNIGELTQKYGDGPPDFYPKTFQVMMDTSKQSRVGYESVLNNPRNPKKNIKDLELEALKIYARSLGIQAIGFSKVDPKLVFKNHNILYDNAIVITMEMDKEIITNAPSKDAGHEVHYTYNKLGRISNELSEYLRSKGFAVQAGPALGGNVDYKHLAQSAGLGAIGNHGLLISPQVGPRQRITAIYTSIENLPYPNENTHTWIKDFCKTCKICEKNCPADALVGIEKASENNIYIDLPKCVRSFATNYGCSVCIRDCVFNKGDYERIKASHMRR